MSQSRQLKKKARKLSGTTLTSPSQCRKIKVKMLTSVAGKAQDPQPSIAVAAFPFPNERSETEVNHSSKGSSDQRGPISGIGFQHYPEGGPLSTTVLSPFASTNPGLAKDRACLCARIADNHKADDVVILDMRKLSPLYDFFVIATAKSRRQAHTIVEDVDRELTALGDRRMSIEGYENSTWVVCDYGDVVVHVFSPEQREHYRLDELWIDAEKVSFRDDT